MECEVYLSPLQRLSERGEYRQQPENTVFQININNVTARNPV